MCIDLDAVRAVNELRKSYETIAVDTRVIGPADAIGTGTEGIWAEEPRAVRSRYLLPMSGQSTDARTRPHCVPLALESRAWL